MRAFIWIVCVSAIFHANAALADSYEFGGTTFEFKLPPGDCYLEKTTSRAQRFFATLESVPHPETQYLFVAARCEVLDRFRGGDELLSYYMVVGQVNPVTGEPMVIPGVTRKTFASKAAGLKGDIRDEAEDRAKERSASLPGQVELKNLKMGEPQLENDVVYMPIVLNMQAVGATISYAGVTAMVFMSGRLFQVINLAPHRGDQTYADLFGQTRSIVDSILTANPGSEKALPKPDRADAQLPSAPLATTKSEPEAQSGEEAPAAAEPEESKTAVAEEASSVPRERRSMVENLLIVLGFLAVLLLAAAGFVAIMMWLVKKLRRV